MHVTNFYPLQDLKGLYSNFTSVSDRVSILKAL